MPETQFVIFSDRHNRQAVKNVTRQPLSNIENMGKSVSSGPIKPNEPMKKSTEPKKTFLSNTGKALQSTPVRKVFTPQAVTVSSLIYNDENYEDCKMLEIEFTKPTYTFDKKRDLFDFLLPEPELARHDESPPLTPPPETRRYSMEQASPYQDEFFTDADNFSPDRFPDDDLGLPALY